MNAEKYHAGKWMFVTLLIAGTVIRFIYGYFSQAWLAAPDQLAWGLDLDEMVNSRSLNYVQLVHAPHEGGSVLVSLLSLLFRPLTAIMPPLSWAAIVIDTLSRAVQLKLSQKLFGNRTAILFGVWTVLSVPLLIPWATVNFGLHSLFSFIPFVFLYVVTEHRKSKYLPVICGVISGIAISISYDNLVLLLGSVYLLAAVSQTFTNVLNKLAIFTLFFLLAVLPHVFARICFDPAFGLGTGNIFSVRDVPVSSLLSVEHLANLITVWFTSFPGSFLLSFPVFLPSFFLCGMVSLFGFAGFFFYVKNKAPDKCLKWLPLVLIVFFVIAYALSPFYESSFHATNYVYYRHWCYIIPLVTLIMIHGFVLAGKKYMAMGWIVLCGIASIAYMCSARKIEQPLYKAAGWILAKKYVNDPEKLFQVYHIAGQHYRSELLVGYGWGLSAAILNRSSDETAIENLVDIIRHSPAACQPDMINGVYYSFTKGVTPVLDPQLQEKVASHFSK